MLDAQEKINIIIDYFMDHKRKRFDATFVNEMQEILDNGDELTPSQERALENIITKFEMII